MPKPVEFLSLQLRQRIAVFAATVAAAAFLAVMGDASIRIGTLGRVGYA